MKNHRTIRLIYIVCFLYLSLFALGAERIGPLFRLSPDEEGGWYGWDIASIDVNGDGFDDILVSAPLLRDSGSSDYRGSVYIYFAGGDLTEPDIVLDGHETSEQFGISIDNAGDVNGDGFDDMIVGANVTSDIGRAYLFLCGPAWTGTYELYTSGENRTDNYGYSSSGVGDINNDGYDDYVIGALYNDARGNRTGRAYLYFGNNPPDSTCDMIFTGLDSLDDFATDIDGYGDFNGDGYLDILSGAVQAGSYWINPGESYVYFGGDLLDTIPDIRTRGENPMDFNAGTVSFIGDINNDGFDDFITGAYNYGEDETDKGRAYIYFGNDEGDNIPDIILTGKDDDNLGGMTSGGFDIDGDGFSDFAVSVDYPLEDYPDSGRGAILIYTGSSDPDTIFDYYMAGEYPSDYFGWSLEPIGDMTGDGIEDIAVGATRWNGRGAVYIYPGLPRNINDFSCEVIIQSGDLAEQSFVFGLLSYATDGYDPGLDIIRLPVIPDMTDVGIKANSLIPEHISYFRREYRSTSTLCHPWNFELISPFETNVKWRYGDLPQGIFLVDSIHDMKCTESCETPPGHRDITIEYSWSSSYDIVGIEFEAGWNLVGLPGYPLNYSLEHNFGEHAFFFKKPDNMWYSPDEVQTGFGCFTYSASTDYREYVLLSTDKFKRILYPGWNLITGTTYHTPLAEMVVSPVGALIPGALYEFDPISSSYVSPDYIEPGKGYFVLSASICTLTVGRPSGTYARISHSSNNFDYDGTLAFFGNTPPLPPQIFDSINDNISEDDNIISIYPNPCNDIVNISSKYEYNVFDLNGNIVFSGKSNSTIDTGKLNPGIYLIKIQTNKNLVEKKLLKID